MIKDKETQATIAIEQAKMELEERKNIRDNKTKLQIALIGKEGDYTEEDASDFEQLKFNKEFSLKEKDLNEKVRHNKVTEQISKNKPKSK